MLLSLCQLTQQTELSIEVTSFHALLKLRKYDSFLDFCYVFIFGNPFVGEVLRRLRAFDNEVRLLATSGTSIVRCCTLVIIHTLRGSLLLLLVNHRNLWCNFRLLVPHHHGLHEIIVSLLSILLIIVAGILGRVGLATVLLIGELEHQSWPLGNLFDWFLLISSWLSTSKLRGFLHLLVYVRIRTLTITADSIHVDIAVSVI